MTKICKTCKKEFRKGLYVSKKRWKKAKFCSIKCYAISIIGHKSHRKGKKFPQITGEKHYAWKGKKVGYFALHTWICRKKGKPTKCENPDCIYPRKDGHGRIMIAPKKFHWANIDHKYRRVLSDYISLCVPCHKRYDLDNGLCKH